MTEQCSLHSDGFRLVQDILDASQIDRLRVAVSEETSTPGGRQKGGARYAMRGLIRAIPLVRDLADSSSIRALVKQHLGANAFVVRSILFDKRPGANWSVAWHQDTTIAVEERFDVPGFGPWSVKDGIPHVRPPLSILENMLAVRIHLDATSASNGALRVLSGSHRHGILDGEAIERMKSDGRPFTCEAMAGDILLMRPLLLHASAPCETPAHRRVIHLEFAAEPLPGRLRWACF